MGGRRQQSQEELNTGTRVQIAAAADIVAARDRARSLATELGFSASEATLITAAISEIARNIVDFAEHGEVLMDQVQGGGRRGIQIIARDRGPGIPDIEQAMKYGYSTGTGLGVGLPAARWLMDEFKVESRVGEGTTVRMKKWLNQPSKRNLDRTQCE